MSGKLYVVATPIGNLADFSSRAIDVLKQVDLIAAEDTRHVKILLQHYGIVRPLTSLHQHNEDKVSLELVEKMRQGVTIALVSDAGTPLLSDPGLPLIRLAKENGFEVSPVPGACALIAALSVSGLPLSQFTFEGFLPRTAAARKNFFQKKAADTTTWAFYESSHRILYTLQDMTEVLESDREVVVARELTKMHETIVKDRLSKIVELVKNNDNMQKGEFVVIVAGAVASRADDALTDEQKKIFKILLTECSVKTAASLAAEITGQRKKHFYQFGLEVSN